MPYNYEATTQHVTHFKIKEKKKTEGNALTQNHKKENETKNRENRKTQFAYSTKLTPTKRNLYVYTFVQ